jgi:hypothetical protein
VVVGQTIELDVLSANNLIFSENGVSKFFGEIDMVIPIHISGIEQYMDTDSQTVFNYLATFGEAQAGSEMTSRVLSRDNGTLLVEFNTQFHCYLVSKRYIER